MMRSMFAGVSGLRNHQIRLDVIGNNIANVNTIAFKSGRLNFQDIFSQTIRGASTPTANLGGTNPQQVGLGMTVSSIDVLHTQGNMQLTGKMSDLAIQGNGFFIAKGPQGTFFTRAGNFEQDANGYLVNPANGLRVQGWMAQPGGVFPNQDEANLTDIRIPVGQSIPAQASTTVRYAHNLNAEAELGSTREAPAAVYDSQGKLHEVGLVFTKTDVNEWTWEATVEGAVVGGGVLQFGPDGILVGGGVGTVTFSPPGVDPLNIDIVFPDVTQFASESSISAVYRDGYPMGILDGYTIDSNGVITGVYTNGLSQPIAQVALSVFSNPSGLIKRGDNLYEESNNSGIRQIGIANSGGRGSIAPNNLEMSNVDLAREFTDMIVTQRGFQANSRIITTSDEMLQELVNMKR